VNAPNLARRLATRIIEGLQGRGRIVVVRGASSALVRSVDDAISAFVSPIADRFDREPSSPEDHQTREAITLLASSVARTLFSSEHLEDVFADRTIVEREVFDAARSAFVEAWEADRARVMHIELDLLGYVAATAGKLAPEEQIIVALERAAISLGVKLSSYDAASREAIFETGNEPLPDLRLELEEAIADELSSLVARGLVMLPVIERTRPLVRRVDATRRTRLLRVMDRAATRTLRRTGCSARWELPDDRTVRVVFTPLSEQDAREVDAHVTEFASEIDAILADAGAPLVTDTPTPAPAPPAEPAVATGAMRHDGNGTVEAEEVVPESEPEPVVVPKRAPRAGVRAKAPPRVAPKRTPAKRATKRVEATEGKPAARKKTAVKKRGTSAKKKSAAKKG